LGIQMPTRHSSSLESMPLAPPRSGPLHGRGHIQCELLVAPGGKGTYHAHVYIPSLAHSGFASFSPRPRVHLSQRLLLSGFVSRAPPPGLFFSSFARTLPPKALALHTGMDAVVGIHSLRSLILRVSHLRAGEGGRTRHVDPSSLVESLRIVFAARRCRKCPCPCLEAPLCIFPLCFPDPTTLVELPYCGRPQAHRIRICVFALYIKHAMARKIEWAAGVLAGAPRASVLTRPSPGPYGTRARRSVSRKPMRALASTLSANSPQSSGSRAPRYLGAKEERVV
jgi:hypothetical protein